MPDAVKMTLFFQGKTVNSEQGINGVGRTYGFTESYYYSGSVTDAIKQLKGSGKLMLAPGLASARAQILPEQCNLIGYRAQLVSTTPPGPSYSDTLFFPGQDVRTDMPQVSLLVRLRGSGVSNVRRQLMRCMPDEYIVDGEYAPSAQFRNKVSSLINELGNWNFRAIDAAQPKIPVSMITADGVVTTTVPHGIPLNARVKVGRGRTISKRRSFSGTFQVVTVPSATTLVIAPYVLPFEVKGGYIRRELIIYPLIDQLNSKPLKSAIKKVGRPFDRFIGRATLRT